MPWHLGLWNAGRFETGPNFQRRALTLLGVVVVVDGKSPSAQLHGVPVRGIDGQPLLAPDDVLAALVLVADRHCD